MSTWSFYSLALGTFTGQRYSGPLAFLEVNTPPDCGAMAGRFHPLEHMVDLELGVVVPYQPPAPANTDLIEWAWDADAHRYVGTPTLLALERDAHSAIDIAAGAARSRYITEVPGQQAVYLRKAEQARAFTAAGYEGTAPPYVAAEAAAMDMTPAAAAQRILEIADVWDDVLSPAIEQVRIGAKAQVTTAKQASDRAALLAAQTSALTALAAI